MNEKLISLIACPVCLNKVIVEKDQSGLYCEHCKVAYPVENGVPKMLISKQRNSGNRSHA